MFIGMIFLRTRFLKKKKKYLCTAAAGAARSSRVPSAAAWAVGPCRAACGPGRFPATAPASAGRPAASPARPGRAAACVPPRAKTPPAVTARHQRYFAALHISNTAPSGKSDVDGKRRSPFADLIKVLAQQGPGLGGRQVTEFGHEVHLPLGEHAGRGPQLPLPLSDGFVLVLDGGI